MVMVVPFPNTLGMDTPQGDTESPDRELTQTNPALQPTLADLVPGLNTEHEPQEHWKFGAPSVDQLLKWSGIALVVLAMGFFMNVAIERGWLTPELRVLGGLGVGLGLVGIGHGARAKRPAFGRTLQAGGLVVTYLTLWAAHAVLGLISFNTTFALMALVSAGGLMLGELYRDPAVAGLASVGGLATPVVLFLSGTKTPPSDSPATMVAYSAVLLAVTTWLYTKHRWRSLLWASSTGGALNIFIAAAAASRADSHTGRLVATAGVAMIIATAWAIPVALGDSDRGWETKFEKRLGRLTRTILHQLSITTPIWAWAVLTGVWSQGGSSPAGEAAGAVGLVAAAIAILAKQRSLRLTNVATALMMGFIAMANMFDGSELVLAFAAYVVVIQYTADRLSSKAMRVVGHGVSLFLILALFDRIVISFTAPTGLDLLADAVAVGSFGITAFLVKRRETRAIYGLLAYIGAHFWVLEAATKRSGGLAIVSAGWAIIGVAAFVYGRTTNHGTSIKAGAVTLVVVIGKLFLVDLAEVDSLIKVFLFLGVGLLFLAVSYFSKDESEPEQPAVPV